MMKNNVAKANLVKVHYTLTIEGNFNHSLAGKTLYFEVEITDIKQGA